MAGFSTTVTAKTKTELRQLAKKWEQQAKGMGLDVDAEYDPARVVKTEEGYEISLHAHT